MALLYYLHSVDCHFVSLVVDPDKGDVSAEDTLVNAGLKAAAHNIDTISDRGFPQSVTGNIEPEHIAALSTLVEDNTIERYRYKVVAGEVAAGSHPGRFIDPLEQIAAKEEAKLVEVLRKDQLIGAEERCAALAHDGLYSAVAGPVAAAGVVELFVSVSVCSGVSGASSAVPMTVRMGASRISSSEAALPVNSCEAAPS